MDRGGGWYWFVRNAVRYGFFGPLGGLRVRGLENVPSDGPLIVASNHVSFADPPVVSCSMPRAVHFMAKEELFKPPVFGPLIASLKAFPVSRGAGDKAAIKKALEVLAQGHALLVFPEGTRGDGEELLPFQSGVALLAKRSGANVLPFGICGSRKLLPKGKSLPRWSPVTAHIGQPLTWEEFPKRDEFNAELRQRMESLLVSCH